MVIIHYVINTEIQMKENYRNKNEKKINKINKIK